MNFKTKKCPRPFQRTEVEPIFLNIGYTEENWLNFGSFERYRAFFSLKVHNKLFFKYLKFKKIHYTIV